MSYQLTCTVPPETDGSCSSVLWVQVHDLALMDMVDANSLVMFAITGFLTALVFRWAIHQIFNKK